MITIQFMLPIIHQWNRYRGILLTQTRSARPTMMLIICYMGIRAHQLSWRVELQFSRNYQIELHCAMTAVDGQTVAGSQLLTLRTLSKSTGAPLQPVARTMEI
jgi:hypothetical protein